MNEKVSYRKGRYYIKDTNIRVDSLVGLSAKEISENYPWLSEKQISDTLEFVKETITKRAAKRETSTKQIQAS